jgi:hypothetical protein
MTFPTDLEGREAQRDELIRTAEERARRQVLRWSRSPYCSGLDVAGHQEHDRCVASPERCICECHAPKRTQPHEADS